MLGILQYIPYHILSKFNIIHSLFSLYWGFEVFWILQDMVAAKPSDSIFSRFCYINYWIISFWNVVYLERQTAKAQCIQACQCSCSGARTAADIDYPGVVVIYVGFCFYLNFWLTLTKVCNHSFLSWPRLLFSKSG